MSSIIDRNLLNDTFLHNIIRKNNLDNKVVKQLVSDLKNYANSPYFNI